MSPYLFGLWVGADFVEFKGTVKIASSNSIADADEIIAKQAKREKIPLEIIFTKFFINYE